MSGSSPRNPAPRNPAPRGAPPRGPARRVILAAGLGVAAAAAGSVLGLQRTVHHKVAVPPPAPPAELVALLDAHVQLQTDCDALAAGSADEASTLGPLRSDLSAHEAALRAVLDNYPGWRYEQSLQSSAATASGAPAPASSGAASSGAASSGTASSAPTPTVASLTAALRTQASQLSTDCANWPTVANPAAGTATPADGTTSPADIVGLLGSMAACLNVHLALAS